MIDGKFNVIGGGWEKDGKALSCGEEYDFEAKKWRQTPNIFFPGPSIAPHVSNPKFVIDNLLFIGLYLELD